MLREFVEAVELVTTRRLLVLVLEDLHWSDAATLALLMLLTRRRTPAHLLVLGTSQPTASMTTSHPFRTVMQDAGLDGQSVVLALASGSEVHGTARPKQVQAQGGKIYKERSFACVRFSRRSSPPPPTGGGCEKDTGARG